MIKKLYSKVSIISKECISIKWNEQQKSISSQAHQRIFLFLHLILILVIIWWPDLIWSMKKLLTSLYILNRCLYRVLILDVVWDCNLLKDGNKSPIIVFLYDHWNFSCSCRYSCPCLSSWIELIQRMELSWIRDDRLYFALPLLYAETPRSRKRVPSCAGLRYTQDTGCQRVN